MPEVDGGREKFVLEIRGTTYVRTLWVWLAEDERCLLALVQVELGDSSAVVDLDRNIGTKHQVEE
jgi:hypothetical protein